MTKTKQTKLPNNERYAYVQISREAHKMLKEYCNFHGFKMSALLNNVIKRQVNSSN
jgi:hypothetical protein